jgi:ATP-dependent HslUV protease subunit HslV
MNLSGTTIIAVRRNGEVAIAGDGQITMGDTVLKHKASKLRSLYNGRVICGFAGAVGDALTLFDKFENYVEKNGGKLRRAAIELVKEWRSDRMLRHLEAWIIVASMDDMLVISGEGEVVEPDGDAIAIGSGAGYAQAAAKALLTYSELGAVDIARISMEITSEVCIYTNRNISFLSLK